MRDLEKALGKSHEATGNSGSVKEIHSSPIPVVFLEVDRHESGVDYRLSAVETGGVGTVHYGLGGWDTVPCCPGYSIHFGVKGPDTSSPGLVNLTADLSTVRKIRRCSYVPC